MSDDVFNDAPADADKYYVTERYARLGGYEAIEDPDNSGQDPKVYLPDHPVFADGEEGAMAAFNSTDESVADIFGFHAIGGQLAEIKSSDIFFEVLGALNDLTGSLQESAIISAQMAALRQNAEKRFVDEVSKESTLYQTDLYEDSDDVNEIASINNSRLSTRIDNLQAYQRLYDGDVDQFDSYTSSAMNDITDYFSQVTKNIKAMSNIITAIFKV